MSIAEILPAVGALPRPEKLQLMQFLVADLAREDRITLPETPIVLKPEDQCPYSPAELAEMRRDDGGRPLAEIWRSLGRS